MDDGLTATAPSPIAWTRPGTTAHRPGCYKYARGRYGRLRENNLTIAPSHPEDSQRGGSGGGDTHGSGSGSGRSEGSGASRGGDCESRSEGSGGNIGGTSSSDSSRAAGNKAKKKKSAR